MVTKAGLFAAVWPETVVSDAALASCIQELRQALRDDAKRPRYIVTVHRRGFQFVGKVASSQHSVASKKGPANISQLAIGNRELTAPIVGRAPELGQLHAWLENALAGERQLIFVTGEPGIGKTTVVETFLDSVGAPRGVTGSGESVLIGRGQCVEHFGAGEAYLPVLEALGRLCRTVAGGEVIALLRQQAPTWLVQMPSLLSAAELEELQRRTAGVTRERMLRELAEAVEVMAAQRAVILRFEDLHWSDVSTLDWLASVARRHEQARLLIIGTYRPVEVLTREHPLKGIKQELQLHGQCEELALDFLSEAAVAEYLVQRFNVGATGRSPLKRMAHVIHQRTDGSPLFMVNVVNNLVAQGMVVKTNGGWELREDIEEHTLGTSTSLRQLIEQQIERVGAEERRVLEAASVAGAEFSAAAVAAGAEKDPETVEDCCEALVQREQFLQARGTTEWPDGTIAARYGFIHVLYQEVLYEQTSVSRRIRLHRQIGERQEVAYSERAREIAAELAVHFERGREYRKAIQYLHQAGQNAIRRSAHAEAVGHFTKGLELLKTVPETPERIRHELTLQTALSSALAITKGLGAHEVRKAYDNARELAQRVGETPQLFPVLYGLSAYYVQQEEMRIASDLAEQCLALAERRQDSALIIAACRLLASTSFWSGNPMLTHEYCERGMAHYDPLQHRSLALVYGFDPGVFCLAVEAWALWYLGYPDRALQRSQEALALAHEINHPYTLAFALDIVSWSRFYRREGQAACTLADEAIALSTTQEFPHWLAMGQWMRGQALVELEQWEEGTAQLQQGLEAYRATGAMLSTRESGLAELAKGYGCRGQIEEGLRMIAEALAVTNETGVRHYEAEMYRLKGALTLQSKASLGHVQDKSKHVRSHQPPPPDPQGEAEACFLKAIEIARLQQARSWELRATMSLARMWQQQGKKQQAHKMLADIYGWFTEGFDTADLKEAKELLEDLV